MQIDYTTHALRRMTQRAISRTDVESTFANPSKVEQGAAGRWKSLGKIRGRTLVIVWVPRPPRGGRLVVTVYWLDEGSE